MLVLCVRANADASGPYLYSRVDPPVIFNDGQSPVTFQVATTKTGVKAVNYYSYGPSGVITTPMYDDGTHGDLVAGDGIYTLNNILIPPVQLYFGGAIYRGSIFAQVIPVSGSPVFGGVDFGLVAPQLQYGSTKLANNIYATQYAVFVTDPAVGPTAGFTPNSDSVATQANSAAFLARSTQALYSVLGDQFDFVVAMPGRPIFDPQANYGVGVPFFSRVSSQIQNIGITPVDNTAQWGSRGQLKGVIYHSFGERAILTHEFGHNWMAYIGTRQNLSGCAACTGPHWNADSDIGRVMSSFLTDPRLPTGAGWLSENNSGFWQLTRDLLNPNGSYSMLDLYLMGLVPSSAVANFHLLTTPDLTNLANVTTQSTGTFRLLDVTGGERVPSVQSSQKQFATAFVIIKDQAFTPAEFAFFSWVAQYYTSTNPQPPIYFPETFVNPFYAATGGRASMTAHIPVLGGANVPDPTSYQSVIHGASFAPGPLAPGSHFTIKGHFVNDVGVPPASTAAFALNLAEVHLDGKLCRLYYVGPTQINAAIPEDAAPGNHTLTVTVGDNNTVFTQSTTITAQNIAAFTWIPDTVHPANTAPILTNANYTLIGDPSLSRTYAQASPGDAVIIWATGGGATGNPLVDNTFLAPSGSYLFPAPQITIDDNFSVAPQVTYSGRAPQYFSLDQIVFIVPPNLASGPHTIQIGNAIYKNGLWIK